MSTTNNNYQLVWCVPSKCIEWDDSDGAGARLSHSSRAQRFRFSFCCWFRCHFNGKWQAHTSSHEHTLIKLRNDKLFRVEFLSVTSDVVRACSSENCGRHNSVAERRFGLSSRLHTTAHTHHYQMHIDFSFLCSVMTTIRSVRARTRQIASNYCKCGPTWHKMYTTNNASGWRMAHKSFSVCAKNGI